MAFLTIWKKAFASGACYAEAESLHAPEGDGSMTKRTPATDADTPIDLAGSHRTPVAGATRTGRTRADSPVTVTVKLRRRAAMTHDVSSGEALSRDQLAEAFGADPDDLKRVTDTFEALGLSVADASLATRSLTLTGSAGAMEAAFGVELSDYAIPGGGYRGRTGAVQLPASVSDLVVGVFGLDDRKVARRRHRLRTHAHDAGDLAGGAATPLTPAQLTARYSFPPGDGAGQTVGLLEFGGGFQPADLNQFCDLAGVGAAPEVRVVSVGGAPTDQIDDATGEVMLDVEVIAGACPGARIAIYFAAWTEQGWLAALDAALQDKANDLGVLSISWGAPEEADIWTPQAMQQVNEALKDAAALGITVCVATGDDGSSDGVKDGRAHVDFPASSPFALAVGGTTIPGAAAAGVPSGPDRAWKLGDGLRADSGGSSGGGVSGVFPRPSWQAGLTVAPVNAGGLAGRCVPDLAVNADWTTSPYLTVVNGASKAGGGTSAAAPLVAALITRINAARASGGKPRVGCLTPRLYTAATAGGPPLGHLVCVDVVEGDNATAAAGGYEAGPGYDAVSGWGTPDGVKLAAALS